MATAAHRQSSAPSIPEDDCFLRASVFARSRGTPLSCGRCTTVRMHLAHEPPQPVHRVSSGALRVLTGHDPLPVSLCGIGSANGNRTCLSSVQYSPLGSKSLQVGSVRIAANDQTGLCTRDVVTRLSLGARFELRRPGQFCISVKERSEGGTASKTIGPSDRTYRAELTATLPEDRFFS